MKKYYGFVNIENQISHIIKPLIGKQKNNFIIINDLTKNWQNFTGEKFYQFSIPKKIKFAPGKKSNGTLYITAFNPSIAFSLEANSNYFIEKIASYYGYKLISEIRIIQELRDIDLEKKTPEKIIINEDDQKTIDDAISVVNNKELKLILSKLGEAIFGKK